ncbi:(2Fe-2S)-binding protein [Kitasatospora cathayae]|uniref:(2Fe-2S)-binding protein n=1 Tax=Kitasatospora cathayae TaxID=3004092 RepID=A0ABY7QA29_9ACTN|nr:(2Fe-2S)-binding protein [Kitasatospora sp. HUAS 3-15]WBP89564.1 (2Fe-2S)-binding protein [Kitasatospora sp. HUAS 3-15]
MTASSTRPGPAPCAPRTTQAHTPAHAPDTSTPCVPSYHRLTALTPILDVRCAPPRRGGGWLPVADLTTDPAAVRELIAHDARRGLARYGRPLRPDVAAGFGLHRLVWSVSLLFTVPWFLERRVPLLGPGDVSLRRDPTSIELTVRPEAFGCLPDDPAAGSPEARTTPDGAALAAELRYALGEFLAPVLAAFGPAVRRGPRVLWAMATDAVVEGLWYAGGLLGEQERARAELSALLAAGGSTSEPARTPGAGQSPAPAPAPFTPGAGFAPPTPARTGASGTARARASCCLVYTVEPGAMCGGCPRVTRR